MARRNDDSLGDLLAELTARGYSKLPISWQLGLIPAIFLILYFIPPLFSTSSLFHPFALIIWHLAAWVISFGLSMLALRNYLKSRQGNGATIRTARHSDVTIDDLHKLTWSEFEDLVAQAYRKQGYTIIPRGGAQPDGGIDLIAMRDGDKLLVQCKHWKTWNVGVKEVRAMYGVLMHEGAQHASIVTCGRFSPDAQAFATGKAITLVDGVKLQKMLNAKPDAPPPPVKTAATPHCPICDNEMVMRTVQHGEHAGRLFWGCAKFPACRGSLAVDSQALD